MTSQNFDLEQYLPYLAARFAGRISRALAARYQQQFDLSIADWRIIANLSQFDEVSVKDIVARVELDRVKVTRAVQQLVKRGLLSKHINAGDRRLVKLSLTPQGVALFQALKTIAIQFEQEALHGLSDDDKRTLTQLFSKIENNLRDNG